MELVTLDGIIVEQNILSDDEKFENNTKYSPFQKIPFKWIPSSDMLKSFNFPIVSIPLLSELSFYLGNSYWKNNKSSQFIKNRINEYYKKNPLKHPYSKIEQDEQHELIKAKHEMFKEPEEKRSSLLGNLETLCNTAFAVHQKYINSLLTGDESVDYYNRKNELKYVNDFIPRSSETIQITMSDLIHSDGHKSSYYTDRRTKETYDDIFKKIKTSQGVDRVTEYVKLFSIGLAVIKEKQKKKSLKILTPRKHSSEPMIFDKNGRVDFTAETSDGM